MHFFQLDLPVPESLISFVKLTADPNIVEAGSTVMLVCSVQFDVPSVALAGANASFNYGFTANSQFITSQMQADSVLVMNVSLASVHTCTVTVTASGVCEMGMSCPNKVDTEIVALQCKFSCPLIYSPIFAILYEAITHHLSILPDKCLSIKLAIQCASKDISLLYEMQLL